MNSKPPEQHTAAGQERQRYEAIETAARKVVDAFEELGKAQFAGAIYVARNNCETAMVGLKDALFNT
jgi:hypothetical protein